MKVLTVILSILLALGRARARLTKATSTTSQREAIQVGPRDLGEDPRRGNNFEPCEASGRFVVDGLYQSPCVDVDETVPDGLKCEWYPGFQEYYCECTEDPDYCLDATNAFCIGGYEETKITLNGGRKFWNCKSEDAFPLLLRYSSLTLGIARWKTLVSTRT